MAASDVADLISAAYVRFSFPKPRKLPCEADGRSEILPVIRVDGLVRFGGLGADKLELRLQVQVDAVIRAHPPVETATRYSEQRQPALASDRPYRQSLSFVRHAVILVAEAGVQSERRVNLPIVFEEQREFVLMGFEDPPVSVVIAQPFVELIGRLNEIVLERVVHRTGQKVQEAVRRRLIRGDQSREVR